MVDQVLIRLHAFYPQARGAFTGYEIRRYSTDPSTGGSYLAFGPGQISKFWRLWERPLQRVAFAGEHTDTLYPGTLEGALRTGQRAASQVEDLAAGKSFEPAKVGPAAATAAAAGAAGAAVAAKKGNFFTNLFGGSDDDKKPEPVKAPEPAPAPAAPAPVPTPAPAPAPVEAPKPATPVKAEPAKKAAAKPAAKKPAAKTEAKKAPAKSATKKAEPAKKPAAKPAATTETKAQ
jgi:monoamine oxidase